MATTIGQRALVRVGAFRRIANSGRELRRDRNHRRRTVEAGRARRCASITANGDEAPSTPAEPAPIHVGVGGWTFHPGARASTRRVCRDAQELGYAASRLTAIEINATYYRPIGPELREVARRRPPGFVFQRQGLAVRDQPSRPRRRRGGDWAFHGERRRRARRQAGPSSWQFATTRRSTSLTSGLPELLPRSVDVFRRVMRRGSPS